MKPVFRNQPKGARIAAVVLTAFTLFHASSVESAPLVCDGNNHLDDAISVGATFQGSVVAVRWIPATTQTITGAQIFSGRFPWQGWNLPPLAALGVWSDGGGRPGAVLAHTAYFTAGEGIFWQGRALLEPIDVVAGLTYWFVIDPPSGANVTAAPTGLAQPYWGADGAADVTQAPFWVGPYQSWAFKFRLLCGDLSGDEDLDGSPDGSDNCPTIGNPNQSDFDGDGAGDSCDSDVDGDGVLDSADQCSYSAGGTVVVGTIDTGVADVVDPGGCTLSQRIALASQGARNHGDFMQAVLRLTESLDKLDQAAIIAAAGRSGLP